MIFSFENSLFKIILIPNKIPIIIAANGEILARITLRKKIIIANFIPFRLRMIKVNKIDMINKDKTKCGFENDDRKIKDSATQKSAGNSPDRK